ncbi:hypothetical protein SAMN04490357_1746 [Streptomyces misionensis]|uniref:Uncharacterized protein n=1 Tax=Streptomyces misionensis TaxID=67331 RepID=A0A1H4RNE3_9ACTN|nr:hypothetical protein [Streptomyces misionensis]SEC33410.1 hypothetical protein SAMN04490357_1746 [Streptomyces misionensis]
MDFETELASTRVELNATRQELARLRAGLSAGLTPEQSARLQGSTPEELTADARTLAAELGVSTARQPSGSGADVGSAHGSLSAGEQRYQAKNPEGQRFMHGGYTLERG